MDDANLMRVGKAVGGLCDDRKTFLDADRLSALAQDLVKRAAAHQLHHHVEVGAFEQRRKERCDIGMVETRKTRRLGAKSRDEIRVPRQFGAKRFDRHRPLDERIDGDMHCAHGARAEQLDDPVMPDHALLVHGLDLQGNGDLARGGAYAPHRPPRPGSALSPPDCRHASVLTSTMRNTPTDMLSWPPPASARSINSQQASWGSRPEMILAMSSSSTRS